MQREQAAAEVERGLGLAHEAGQGGIGRQAGLEGGAFVVVEPAEHVVAGEIFGIIVHGVEALRVARSSRSPRRIQLLTVPAGCARRWAISAWVSVEKSANSSA